MAYQHTFDHFPIGEVQWVALNVDLPPDWSLIKIGARELHFCGLNDTTIHTTMNSKIVVEEVSIVE